MLSKLDENQKLCLRLVHQGYTSKQIAQQTHLSAGTVDQYIFRANAILGVTDRREAARLLATAEHKNQLKQFQLRSEHLAGETKTALIAEQGDTLPTNSARSIDELTTRASSQRSDRGLAIVIKRTLAVVGGKPHELNFRQKLLATSWVALASGGTLSALVAIGYWLNHLMS
ncbi:helix-turn-helix domain-containing protein [Blastomonas sp. SL216]|uniref:helix-turn-helix domain-containing protein n=1 Tax=Blastomonas sp. SL216 TaxID=2995169 RepID=UPI0023777C73|nr:helix-turn-helix transcriptional regulator [Blastomonas sp. SL216]